MSLIFKINLDNDSSVKQDMELHTTSNEVISLVDDVSTFSCELSTSLIKDMGVKNLYSFHFFNLGAEQDDAHYAASMRYRGGRGSVDIESAEAFTVQRIII